MRTRAENLSLIRNVSGGIYSAGNPYGQKVQGMTEQQNKGVRNREESLHILRTVPAILNREAVKNPVKGTPDKENYGALSPKDSWAALGGGPQNSSPAGELWTPQSASQPAPLSGEPSARDDYRQMSVNDVGATLAVTRSQSSLTGESSAGNNYGATADSSGFSGTSGSFAKSDAHIELERLKPVLEEATQLQGERERYISGAMRDPARASSAQTRLNNLLERNGYSSYDELNKAVIDYTLASGNKLSFMQKLDKAGYAMEEGLKNSVLSGDWWKNIISGGAEQWYGSQLNGAGTIAGNVESFGKESTGMVYENELRARNDWATTLEEAKSGVIKMDAEGIAEIEKILDYYDNTLLPSLRSGVEAYETLAEDSAAAADEITAKGQQNTEKAKEGLGWGGQLAVDVLTQGTMMALDRATGAPSISLFTRGFGSGAQEARQAGATVQEQIGYGAAVGTVEALTEKLFDGLAGIYGKGAADKVVEDTIAKLAKSSAGQAALRLLASGFNEGMEEILSDAVNPLLRTIYSNKSVKEEYSGEQLSQWLYDGLVGAIMGTGLTAVNPETYAFNPGDVQTGAAQANPASQPSAEQKNTASEEAESTAVNTDRAQHTAVEQAVIDEYQAAVDDKLVKYIETVRDNKGAKIGRYSLKPVAERAAKDIMQLTGVDASGNQTAIEARIIEHILKRHGENGTANHSMRDINDIARIQYVLDNYDTASYGGKSAAYQTVKPNGRPGKTDTVIFSKAVNGTYYVIEAVPVTKKKTVFITSAYMSNQNAGDVQTADADAWRVTSETKNAQSPAVEDKASTNAILAQPGGNYHNNYQAPPETANTAAKSVPAGAVVEPEYRIRVADTPRVGNYQLALKLFNEFGNVNLCALIEFHTRRL